MDSNFSLPTALFMAFFMAAPPAGLPPQPAVPEPTELETILEGQEALFERNVRACLSQMAPLMPSAMRAAMAEQVTAQWYESGFESAQFIVDIDVDEMEALAETMEEEVLPALEDAGYAIPARQFRAVATWSHGINRVRAAQCATQMTLEQLQLDVPERRASVDEALPDGTAATEQERPAPDEEGAVPAEDTSGGIHRIVY